MEFLAEFGKTWLILETVKHLVLQHHEITGYLQQKKLLADYWVHQ